VRPFAIICAIELNSCVALDALWSPQSSMLTWVVICTYEGESFVCIKLRSACRVILDAFEQCTWAWTSRLTGSLGMIAVTHALRPSPLFVLLTSRSQSICTRT
jgi:hypothetical protein